MAKSIDDRLLDTLSIQNLRGAVAIGAPAPLSDQATTIATHGVAPGRQVLDSVTGLIVEVISSTIVHIPVDAIPEVNNG